MLKKKKKIQKSFRNANYNIFHLTFPNGNWISSIWGVGSYTENHDWLLNTGKINGKSIKSFTEQISKFKESDTVEVMIECGDKLSKRIHKKYDGDGYIIGYLTILDWVDIVNKLAKE